MEEDERIFSVTDPADLMETPPWDTADTEESDPYWHQKDEYVRRECAKAHKEIALREAKDKERESKVANTLTAAQREKLRKKENPGPERRTVQKKFRTLDPEFAEELREPYQSVKKQERKQAEQAWMKKLKSEDYSGPVLDRSRYLTLRNQEVLGNPRQTAEYRKLCREAVGVGPQPDMQRYAHLEKPDFDVIRWVVDRGSGCFWLPDSPRTTVKGFRHRLITRGPPIRRPLFRLNRPDTEWIEKAVAEDVKRGQLEKGNSDWGFPAFPTKEAKAYKAIKRGRRMVVDYRELNKVTVR
ncbi:MAG: hypothetical protein QF745_09705, partial [Planctomycetota bacterium]|nr:hypothetical protein [Planctomycetota bacterium]